MNARVAALGLVLLVAGAPAVAEDDDDYEVDTTLAGYYVAISGGGALEQFSGVNGFDDGFGGGAAAGYRAGEFVSIEVQAEFLENFDTRRGAFSNEVDLWLTTINFRLHFPMGRFEPYLTYGGGAIGVDSTGAAVGRLTRTDIVFKGGGGLAWYWNDAVSIYGAATYALPIGSAKRYDHATFVVGAMYKWEE